MNFKCKYDLEQLVEYDPPTQGDGESAFGFIKSVSFRRVDAVNYIAEYSIHRCNEGTVDGEVRESEIKAVYHKDTVTPI